ncbi:MAG: hypothetical protein LBB81_03555 [Treponema sp.]|jgi:hypothetical protein|nr:hypothetical protein [Treponema sp.]
MASFIEGFCWSLINGTRSENDLKFRLSTASVYDVGGMSLHSVSNCINNKFIVCIGNSNLTSRYTESFVNFTVNFQINDARQIPIIIPNKNQLDEFESLFDIAYTIKKGEYSNHLPVDKAEIKLAQLQEKLDNFVKKLYNLI